MNINKKKTDRNETMTLKTESQNGRILLRFPFNESLKNELKSTIRYPDCQWDGAQKAWSIKDTTEVKETAIKVFNNHDVNADSLGDSKAVENDSSDGIVANWFKLDDNAQKFHAYWINVPDGDEAWSNRRKIVNEMARKNPQNRFAMKFKQMICIDKISPSQLVGKPLKYAGEDVSDEAHEAMLLEILKKEVGDDDYDNMWGQLVSKQPIAESGGYELYQKHQMRVRTFDGVRVLQASNSTVRSTKETILDLSAKDKLIAESQKLKHIYDGGVCQFHGYQEGNPSSTKLDAFGGRTLLEFMEKEANDDRRKQKAVTAIKANPESRLVFVSYSRKQRQKREYLTSAECLLKEVVDNEALPSYVAREFMKHSHINIHNRMIKTSHFRVGLEGTSLAGGISKIVEKVSGIGFSETNVDGNNITFGGGRTTGWSPGDLSRGFNQNGSLLKVKSHTRIAFIPHGEVTEAHIHFVKQVMDLVKKGCNSCEYVGVLKPSSELDMNVSRLSRDYELDALTFDCAIIELPEHDELKWKAWKKAANRMDVRTQMFTTGLINDRFAPMNVAFGILGKSGGVPFTVANMKTDIEMWIGMDVGRRPGSNLGAACVAFEADGRQIGWSAPELLEGETINSDVLKRVLVNFIEEVNILRERNGKASLQSVGLLRDGLFHEEMSVIKEVEKRFNMEIHVFEIRKSGAPRLSNREGSNFHACKAGTVAWKGDWGFIQPTKEGIASPVIRQILRKKSTEKMEDILHDIFWLSKMHLGATMQPGLPVPIHYADKLSKYAGLGVIRDPSFTINLDFL
jgi:hypothetical protein